MEIKYLKILIGMVICLLFGFSIGNYHKGINSIDKRDYANSVLYNMNIEVDLLDHWMEKYKNDKILEENIKHLVSNDINKLAVISPKINELDGVPLEALARLIMFSKKDGIGVEAFKGSNVVSTSYLSSVEDRVIQELRKRKSYNKNIFR